MLNRLRGYRLADTVQARASAGCVWRVTNHGNGTTVANR
jgi:hypothetical protein